MSPQIDLRWFVSTSWVGKPQCSGQDASHLFPSAPVRSGQTCRYRSRASELNNVWTSQEVALKTSFMPEALSLRDMRETSAKPPVSPQSAISQTSKSWKVGWEGHVMFTSRASSSVVSTPHAPNAHLLLPLTQKGRKLLKPTEWKNHRGSKTLKKINKSQNNPS